MLKAASCETKECSYAKEEMSPALLCSALLTAFIAKKERAWHVSLPWPRHAQLGRFPLPSLLSSQVCALITQRCQVGQDIRSGRTDGERDQNCRNNNFPRDIAPYQRWLLRTKKPNSRRCISKVGGSLPPCSLHQGSSQSPDSRASANSAQGAGGAKSFTFFGACITRTD